jgi:hypothetical protein
MNMFEIRLPNELKQDPDYTPPDILREELNNLEYAMVDFYEWYWPTENIYHIVLGSEMYTLYVYELDSLWTFVPYHLQQVVAAKPVAVIGITSQGTNFTIKVSPFSVVDVLVSMVLQSGDDHLSSPSPPRVENSQNIKINRQAYIQEWWKFVEWVRDILIRDKLIEADDSSLQAYLREMPPKTPNDRS